ncbi:MAG TPA: TRAP transporter small permease [Pseudomonadales bacterium]|jgi:TRAP-type C4-dicarboxylate transport system permease small subunit|nr:C4-dicarboxylate ABC transporter permease [Gammaproteobacteria bacterium]MDP6024634.1 TRAP transporter small permease [Pseudomonadales bacterium]MDP7313503.1 TRAP transporter small permease [Pseudomonadales bacterium]HJL61954.1 TRAP transporter small permease [Pseudomonadales bacterium]HJP51265.1 TRAP transporter small permease [Pseudomonadales bacterium]|tara:strand:+ start:6129 stop:6614 length:486 start_codon:yes stop_codon:yes gene_type:complete
MMSAIREVQRILHMLEDGLLISVLTSMLLMAVVQICLRNFFDSGLLWGESFLRILLLWLAMLGAMVATRESNHIRIDVLSRYLGPMSSKAMGLVTNLFSAVICSIVAYHAFEFVQFEFEDKTIAFGNVPVWACQSIIPVGFFIIAVRFVINGVVTVMPGKT